MKHPTLGSKRGIDISHFKNIVRDVIGDNIPEVSSCQASLLPSDFFEFWRIIKIPALLILEKHLWLFFCFMKRNLLIEKYLSSDCLTMTEMENFHLMKCKKCSKPRSPALDSSQKVLEENQMNSGFKHKKRFYSKMDKSNLSILMNSLPGQRKI